MFCYEMSVILLISLDWTTSVTAESSDGIQEIKEHQDNYVCDPPIDVQGLVRDAVIIDCLHENLPKVFGVNMSLNFLNADHRGRSFVPSDLDCSFDQLCEWRNGKYESTDIRFYKVTDGKPNADQLNTLTGSSDTPDPPFAICVAVASSVSRKAWLVSRPVPKQAGSASIQFRGWITPQAELRICTRAPLSATLNGCVNVTSAAGSADSTKVVKIEKPTEQPFEIVFELAAKQGAILMLDDIKYTIDDEATSV